MAHTSANSLDLKFEDEIDYLHIGLVNQQFFSANEDEEMASWMSIEVGEERECQTIPKPVIVTPSQSPQTPFLSSVIDVTRGPDVVNPLDAHPSIEEINVHSSAAQESKEDINRDCTSLKEEKDQFGGPHSTSATVSQPTHAFVGSTKEPTCEICDAKQPRYPAQSVITVDSVHSDNDECSLSEAVARVLENKEKISSGKKVASDAQSVASDSSYGSLDTVKIQNLKQQLVADSAISSLLAQNDCEVHDIDHNRALKKASKNDLNKYNSANHRKPSSKIGIKQPIPPTDSTLKISFMDFSVGDIALFIPVDTQRLVWMAFHSNKPHHYLSQQSLRAFLTKGKKHDRTRILGRIVFIETLTAGSPGLRNPYNLQPGTVYYECFVEPILANSAAASRKGLV